jgi:hypothetical protein
MLSLILLSQTLKSQQFRQLSNSLNLPFLGGDIGIQAFKPIFEAVTNRASFTNSEIVPYFHGSNKNLPINQGQSTMAEWMNSTLTETKYKDC